MTVTTASVRDRVWLHPLAAWGFTLAVAVAASRTRNVALLLLLLSGLAAVVAVVRSVDPRPPPTRVFLVFLRLGALVVLLRVVFGVLFGPGTAGGDVLLDLPHLTLPDWVAGIRLGGPVTTTMVAQSVADGIWLSTLLASVGAASAIADPAELLRAVPGALYELGVSVVVALSFTPRVVADAQRVREARRLRGEPARGPRAFGRTAVGVMEGGLDQAVTLAASMDSRGYGRRAAGAGASRRSGLLLLLGLLLATLGLLGLVGLAVPAALATAALVAGGLCCAAALAVGSRGRKVTRYRRPEAGAGELVVLLAAAVLVAVYLAAATDATPGLLPPAPLTFTPLPVLPAVATSLVVVPAAVAVVRYRR